MNQNPSVDAQAADPYRGFFRCFNEEKFFEAHEVLEVLWLQERHGPRDEFFKGLIQYAGAFVHLQKHLEDRERFGHRLIPAASLFRLARVNLRKYPARFEKLNVEEVIVQIDRWLKHLEGDPEVNPLSQIKPSRLSPDFDSP
jgi:predicted metal-dependent hydrolase